MIDNFYLIPVLDLLMSVVCYFCFIDPTATRTRRIVVTGILYLFIMAMWFGGLYTAGRQNVVIRVTPPAVPTFWASNHQGNPYWFATSLDTTLTKPR